MAWDKVEMRREMGARLELTGHLSDAEIAEAIGITPAGYAQMKRTPEYIQIRNKIKYGVLTDMDEKIGDFTDELRNKVRNALPVALETIITLAHQRDSNGLKAAQTLVEMDGRLAPKAAIEITDKRQIASEDNAMAAALLQAMEKQVAKEKPDENVTIQ